MPLAFVADFPILSSMFPQPPLPEPLWSSIPADAREALSAILLLQQTRIEQLEALIRELQARLDQNSGNSSKPPSSDPPGFKPAPTRLPSGKKPGGQPGHPRNLRVRLEPDRVIDHKPCFCAGCRAPLAGDDPDPRVHQVWELPPVRPDVTEHRFHKLTCPCGRATAADAPADLPADGYGPRLKAAIVYLTGVAHLSKSVAERVLEDLFGTPISTGQICAIEAEATGALAPAIEELRGALPEGDVCMDETSWKQSGRLCWLWVAVAARFTLFHIANSRGRRVVHELLGVGYAHVLSSDRYSAYGTVVRRQICWAHLRRDFQALIDRGGAGAVVGRELLLASDMIFTQWHRIRDGTLLRSTATRRIRIGLADEMRSSLGAGLVCGCARTVRFCESLLRDWDHLWAFCEVEGVEPTNNAAERALRPAVMLRKKSQGTRSESGSRWVASMLSVSATCRQQGRRVWDYLTQVFAASASGRQAPSLLPTS